MAKLAMQKIEMIALLSDAQHIIERLQRRGVVEICSAEDEGLLTVSTASTIALFERNLSAARQAMAELDRYCPEKKPVLSFLNGREPISTKQFAKEKEKTNKTLSLCLTINECSKKINEETNNITRFQTAMDQLSPWLGLELPQNFKGTKKTFSVFGVLPTEWEAKALENALFEMCGAAVQIEIVNLQKGQSFVQALSLKADEKKLSEALRQMDFVPFQSQSKKSFAEEKQELEEKAATASANISILEGTIRQCGDRRREIAFLTDYLQMRIDKYAVLSEVGMTAKTIVLNGYVPKKYAAGLVREFEEKYITCIVLTEPEADEEVPVLLHNGKFSEPVEGITEMYALPNKRDVDPSAVMAFFYYLFFGMMLSDAGYGLLMVIGTIFVLKKYTVEGSLKKTLVMFRNCGISTLFWGVLFGSWFGDLPQVIATNFFGAEDFTTALWFEPLDDPILLLLFSFGLGICHLFLGLAVNFHILWKEGKKLDALCDTIPIYLTILGVAPLGASILTTVPAILTKIGSYFLIAGVVLIVLTAGRSGKNIFLRFFGGIYGLYNVATGYLGDILSYSRLLALGLATGSIAGVINLIATMPQNPVLKAIMLTVVGLVGHTANMGINLLGAYVHSDRLQFVELFSKFYEGGGKAFTPLKANTKYFRFKKENIYND